MIYRPQEVTRIQLKGLVTDEVYLSMDNYFKHNPNKTVFKINKDFKIRKIPGKINMFSINPK